MGKYFSAIVTFAAVVALTLLSFYVAWINYVRTAQAAPATSTYPPGLILIAGIVVASGLAAYLAFSARKKLAAEQLREDKNKLDNLIVSAHKLEAMAQLVGSIAHDFNNVLMTVSGYASLALTRSEDNNDPEMQEYLNLVNIGADKGTGLIKKLLSISRGKSHRRSNGADLTTEVENTVNLLGQILPQRITVQLHIAENFPDLKVDALTLEQILTNLVVNANEAIEHNGIVKISLFKRTETEARCNACQHKFSGEFACLTVTDTGRGLTLEKLDEIFQPFYTTKHEGTGAGLGLALVQNLVHGTSGHIQLTSEPGSGTAVTIFLPLPAATGN